MLAKRIIPTLLYKGATLVKGTQFNNWRSVGNVMQAARIHAGRGVDELCILDVAATPEGRGPNFELIEQICEDNFTPITVGGGITTMAQVDRLFRSGADKILVGWYLGSETKKKFIRSVSDKYGNQAIVVSIDACQESALYYAQLAWMAQEIGAGEILLNNKLRDGVMCGLDYYLIKEVCGSVQIPVIACGGCMSYEDMRQAIKAGADAVAVGALFQFTDCTPRGAAEYLKLHGVEVR